MTSSSSAAHEGLGEPPGPLDRLVPKRPRSQSQLWLTGSESTPRKRTRSPAEDWATIRQPTAQAVQVVSICSRSHGRDLNRYGAAVSAPTGQIWIVLPAK